MGVEFFECSMCGDTICDAGSWWTCDVCGMKLCENCEESTGASNRAFRDDEDADEDTPNPECPFCTRAEATDFQLLEFALGRLDMARDQLMHEYRAALNVTPDPDPGAAP